MIDDSIAGGGRQRSLAVGVPRGHHPSDTGDQASSDSDQDGPDGLTLLQGMLASGRQPPIGETLAFSLVEVARGHAVFEGAPGRSVYNPIGSVHGGCAPPPRRRCWCSSGPLADVRLDLSAP